MLSIDNPPPDPPCLNNSNSNNNNSDERASTSTSSPRLAFSQVDLQPNDPPHSNFSIREYVFGARSKNIQTNWPFSQKNLQLCLKHGVKDVLPPFQRLDTVRNQFSKRCKVETRSLQKESVISNCERGLSSCVPDDDRPLLDSNANSSLNCDITESCKDISFCKSVQEDDALLTTTSVSGSQLEPVSSLKDSSSILEAEALLETPHRKEPKVPANTCKTALASQSVGKKCRLIVKFGGKSERSSTEDISSNCTSVSETMASKVCPVCKTFSSSSNTTLNAHIDQCLSMESTPKPATGKLIRPRIKPRKIRLMVDIYEKAPRCTLEELDRRNGSNWAAVSSLPKDNKATAEGKKKTLSVVNGEGANDADVVYIDANGTKVRILSKATDAPSPSKVGTDKRLKRSLRGSKGRKMLSTKKKRLHGTRQHKYLRVAPKSKKIHSRRAHDMQVLGSRKKHHKQQEDGEESQRQTSSSLGLTKPGDPGTLRQWVSAKRTDLPRKGTMKEYSPLRCQSHLAESLLVQSGQSFSGNKFTTDLQMSDISEEQKNEGKEKVSRSLGRKRLGSSLFGRASNAMERSLYPAKRKLHNCNSLCNDDHLLNLQKYSERCSSQLRDKTVEIHAGPENSSGISPNASARSSMSSRVISRKAMRFSTLRKRFLSLCQSSEITSRFDGTGKRSSFKKSNMLSTADVGGDVVVSHSEPEQQDDLDLDLTEHQSVREGIAAKTCQSESFEPGSGQEGEEMYLSHREKVRTFRSLPSVRQRFNYCEGENMEPSFAVSADSPRRNDGVKSNVNKHHHDVDGVEVAPRIALEDATWSLSKYFSSGYDNHLNVHFKIQPHSQRLLGTPSDSLLHSFTDEEELSRADEVGNRAKEQNGNDKVDEDSGDGQASFFPEIDPIPIPGPPGSFLPSPGAVGSDDFQGNSSLTTSQVHSSQDQQDLVDGDSSDSPVSATSTISNSMEARLDQGSSERLISASPCDLKDNSWSRFLGTNNEPLLKNAAATVQPTTAVMESSCENPERFRVGNISVKKGPLYSTMDDQPCCCQKKERLSQGVALNNRELPQISRRLLAPLAVPAMGKQLVRSSNAGPNHVDAEPEKFTPGAYLDISSDRSVPLKVKSSTDSTTTTTLDEQSNVPGRGDCDLASPSASNPILRLMGKDLVVVNKEEDGLAPVGQPESQPCALKSKPSPQFQVFSGVPSGGGAPHNQKFGMMDHPVVHGSSITGQDLSNTGEPCFGPEAVTTGFINSKTKVLARMDGLMEAQDYNGRYSLLTPPHLSVEVPNAVSEHKLVRAVSFPDNQFKRAGLQANPHKEIIVIDDGGENNVDDFPKNPEGFRDGVSLSRSVRYDLREVGPSFFSYQSPDPPYYGGCSAADFSGRSNRNPVGSSHNLNQRGSFTAAPASRGHSSSGLVYYPSFS